MSNLLFPSYREVIVAPTHRNGRTLAAVLRQLDDLSLPVVVVNDGSVDETANLLAAWLSAGASETVARFVQTHDVNRGKAAALQTGFRYAIAHGFTHVVTVDTDLQHDVADIPSLLQLSRANPEAMIIGTRALATTGYPLLSRVGRAVSNVLIRLETGLRVSDSQCGLRVYPLALIEQLATPPRRYEFETEVIARAALAGVDVREAPIRCIYDVAGGRVSHFRPIRDSLRAAMMHLRLLTRSLWPWPPPRIGASDDQHTGTIAQRLFRWLSPASAWRDLRAGRGDGRFPASVAAGAMMAVLPLYGGKTVICLGLAKVLRLQPLVVIGVSSLCTPPVGPALAAVSILIGHVLLHGQWANWGGLHAMVSRGWWEVFRTLAVDWVLGSALLGTFLAVVAYFATRWLTRIASRDARHVTLGRSLSAETTAASPATGPTVFPPHS
jgi:uncharacterized protein (DUF2062 family)